MRSFLIVIATGFAVSAFAASNKDVAPVHIPVAFEPNRGQAPAEVKFLADGFRYRFELTAKGARFLLRHGESARRISMTPLAAGVAAIHPTQPLPRVSNYLVGPETDWIRNIPNYGRIEYSNVYANVDLA